MPNAWDAGSARLLASLGFRALATTSSGFAASLGRNDYGVSCEEAIAHGRQIADAVDVPVSADLENGFADEPESVTTTFRLAAETGLAGGSIEDYTGNPDEPLYPLHVAAERVRAAAQAVRPGPGFVLTARAESLLHERGLPDAIERLQAYADAGADVLFAPGLVQADDIRAVVNSVEKPVSVLVLPGSPTVTEMADLGVARISVGGWFAFAALAAVADAGRELIDHGTYGFIDRAKTVRSAVSDAFA
jgi:2-methylisocitrate lyase-like PEP mutase family enzyme